MIGAKMIFRPLISDVYRAGLAGMLCLAGACVSRAGDAQGQPVEAAPAQHAVIDTHVNEPPSDSEPAKDFEKVLPGAAAQPFDSLNLSPETPAFYKPPPARPLTQREQELLDRRRDWVFMSPEELMSETENDDMLGTKDYDKTPEEKKPKTAMERYFQHLVDSDRASATNKLNDWTSETWDKETNSLFGTDQSEKRNEDAAHPFEMPSSARPDPGIFQSARPNTFSDVFDLNTDSTAPSDEAIRAQQEQQAHMEAFKQMWNIDQPAPSSLPSSPVSSGVAYGAGSIASVQPTTGAGSPAASAPSVQQNSSSTKNTLSSERSMLMMHPDFAAPQRRF